MGQITVVSACINFEDTLLAYLLTPVPLLHPVCAKLPVCLSGGQILRHVAQDVNTQQS